MFNIKFKYLLSVGALASFSSFADTSGIVLYFDHPQVLSVSIPNNVTATTFNGVARTTTWKIKSNNAVEIGFSGHSPVDHTTEYTDVFDNRDSLSYENIDPNIPLFYKQEVNARGELIAGEYDYLQTRFGVLITDHDSTEYGPTRHLSNLNIFESGGYPDLYHLIEDFSEGEKNQVKGDAGYNRYGYMETISKASELTAQDRSGYYSIFNSNRYDQYKATTNGDYFDVNSRFLQDYTDRGIHTYYSTGDKILTDDGYKTADTTENYEACTSYQPDPLSETGALICANYETLTRSVERRIDEGVTTQNGTYNAVRFTQNDDMTEAGKTQLYKDLTLNQYGITLWNENMKNSDYSHSNSEVSNKQRSYEIWPLSQEPKVVPNATPEELVHIVHIGFFGDIMPNTEGNFNLALYSVGTVDKPGTQSGLYSMTVVLNVAAKEKY